MIYLHNATLYTPFEKIVRGVVMISGGIITAVGRQDELPCPVGAESVDNGGLNLVPGFIDLQVNGGFGMDIAIAPETIWRVGEYLTRFGVTSFLPTIISSPSGTIHHAQELLHHGPPPGYSGARVIGLHLEGPYLNPEKCGAHDAAYLTLPEAGIYEQWSPSSHVRLVTLAPELPGAIPAIRTLVQNGVLVGAGHSQADYAQAMAGFEAGIHYGTHLFNAMPAFNHRQPGLVGAILGDDRLTAGLILDGIHIHPNMVQFAWKILGPHRTSLVTDAVAALGMPPGEYRLGHRTAFADGSSVKLSDGHLAGSLLSLDQALRNLLRFTGCSLSEALATVTHVPANLLHLESSLGSLAIGSKADLVLLTPDAHIARVWINGKQVRLLPGIPSEVN
jgi:N-acetylglucosamine-6-phosphate deacetylase